MAATDSTVTGTDLAFAGLARQAELIRGGRGLLARARRALPRPHRPARPAAERLPRRASPSRRSPRPSRPTGAAAPATSARCSASRSRSRTTRTSPARSPRYGSDADRRPRHGRLRDRAPPARRRRRDHRQDQRPRADDDAVHRDADRTASRATRGTLDRTPGGSSGGSGAAVAAGLVGAALGIRRRRLDPHPGRLLRPVRPQAAARPRLAGAARAAAGTGSAPSAS